MTSLRRCLQRLSIIALSLMAILAITVPGAQADDGSATITINRPTDITTSLNGMIVKAYMVLDQVNDTEDDPTKKQYDVTEAFKSFFSMRDGENKLDANIKALFGHSDQNVVLTYENNKIIFENKETTASAAAGTIVLTGEKTAQLDETYPEADLVSRLTGGDAGAGTAATFYTWVEKYIETNTLNNPDWANPQKKTCGKDDTSVQFTGLDEGYYALIFSHVPSGVSVKQGILIATPGDIKLKAEEIPLIKQVKNPNHEGEAFSGTAPLKETTANVGDTLEYDITSKVPTVTDSENLTVFKLEDTLANQKVTGTMTLTLSKGQNSIRFTADIPDTTQGTSGAALLQNEIKSTTIAKLTVNPYGANNDKQQTFTIDFMDQAASNAWKNYQGYDITVRYSATVTADAVRVNGNDVKLYINDWDKPLEDRTEVYTYGIKVQKKFSDNSTTANYDAVEFQLRTASDDAGTAIQLSGSNGDYNVPDAESTATTAMLKLSNTDGTLTITGLDLGTYWLVETNAPAGFTKAEPIQIVLVDGSATVAKDGVLDWTEEADGPTTATINNGENLVAGIENSGSDTDTTLITLAKFDVLNQKGFKLPSTGAAGVWLCVAGGLVLIAVAGVLFAASRGRRNAGSASRA